MRFLYAFLVCIVLGSAAQGQEKKPIKAKSKKTGVAQPSPKKRTASRVTSGSAVSTSVVSPSAVTSTPAGSTTSVTTTAASQRSAGSQPGATRVGNTTTTNSDSLSVDQAALEALRKQTESAAPRGAGNARGAAEAGGAGGRPLLRAPTRSRAGSSSGLQRSNEAVVDYDLCADNENGAVSLYLIGRKRNKRNWNYFWATDHVRMRVLGSNPSSCTLTLETVGLIKTFDVSGSPMSVFGLTPPAKDSALEQTPKPPSVPDPALETPVDSAVRANSGEIAAYTVTLREARRALAAKTCLSEADIRAYRDGRLVGATQSLPELINNQHALLARVSNSELKLAAEEGLVTLQAELDQWDLLQNSLTIRGPLMSADDKDYIRFTLKKRCTGETEASSWAVVRIPVFGNFRLNVSTGFLVNSLTDYKYLAVDRGIIESGFPTATTAVTGSTTVITANTVVNAPLSSTSTSTKIPVQETSELANIGVGALLHAYYTVPWFKGLLTPALSVGASLNANGRYTLMLGGSLILGKAQRLVLTGGWAVGPVAQLQQPFTTEARQDQQTASEGKLVTNRTIRTAYEYSGSEFPTVSKTQVGWFVGITFNLSAKRSPVEQD